MFLKITYTSLLNWPIPNFKWQLQVEKKKQIFCLVLHLVTHFMKTKDLKLWVCWLENEHVPRLEFEIYENKHLHLLILQPTQRDVIKPKSPNIKYFCTPQYLCSLFELKTYIWKFICCNLNWNCFWVVTNELWNFISYQSSHYTNTVPCAFMARLIFLHVWVLVPYFQLPCWPRMVDGLISSAMGILILKFLTCFCSLTECKYQ